jgi:predicted proteasome-type protease
MIMTLIVGIKCKDGIVMGADGAATYCALGQATIRQPIKRKLRLLGTQGIAGVSGSVGIGQRFAGEVETIRNLGIPCSLAAPGQQPQRKPLSQLKPHEVMGPLREILWGIIGREMDIAKMVTQTIGNPAPVHSTLSQSMVALIVGSIPCLIQFDVQGMPELATDDLPFASIGSGHIIADPFLAFIRRLFWNGQLPSVEQGIFAAVWAIQHTIETNAGGVGPPIQIVTLAKEKDGASEVWRANEMPAALNEERLQYIQGLEKEIAALPQKMVVAATSEAQLVPPAK